MQLRAVTQQRQQVEAKLQQLLQEAQQAQTEEVIDPALISEKSVSSPNMNDVVKEALLDA